MPASRDLATDQDLLAHLSPHLRHQIERLQPDAKIQRLTPGNYLFQVGDEDPLCHFLLSGQILLYSGRGRPPETVRAIDENACHPIAPGSPRLVTAQATTSATIMSIECSRMQQILGTTTLRPLLAPPVSGNRSPATNIGWWGPKKRAPLTISEQKTPADLLRDLPTPLLNGLPATLRNILSSRLSPQEVEAGKNIIEEGKPSEHYYFIAEGRCRITRRCGPRGGHAIVAVRQKGFGFGEGALIENLPYNNTVTALQDTTLLRLEKGEFLSLLVRPYLNWQSLDEVEKANQQEAGILLDVRSARVYQQGHLPGSINLPLSILPQAAQLLDPQNRYIICCESPRRSMTAAFLLAEQGIQTTILEGGVRRYCA